MAHSRPIVLVVEDETLVRMAIVDHLEEEGFTVLEAANAGQALAVLAQDRHVSILFTDVDMPGDMDGLRLAAAVRERWPPIKIVVTSGHKSVATAELPDDAQFFPKPYRPESIVDAFLRMSEG